MASDFISFNEGADYIAKNGDGLPATCWFGLSTKPCSGVGSFTAADTLAGTGFGEITGTGYARLSQAAPVPSGGVVLFTQLQWYTGTAADWSAPKSLVMMTTSNNTGKLLCAWNLNVGGAADALGQANTYERATPQYLYTS